MTDIRGPTSRDPSPEVSARYEKRIAERIATRQFPEAGNDPQGPPGRQDYLGPGAALAPTEDREIVSFDGRVMILKWIDPEVAGRYGNMVLVRCGVDAPERPARARRTSAAVSQ